VTDIALREQAAPAERLEIVRAGLVDYRVAWDEQRRIQQARIDGTGPDTLLLLEHPSVYTAGKRTEPLDRPVDGTPVIDVDRGGKITWHGPGQLVGYPIIKLPDPVDVIAFVHRVEDLVMSVCADFGVPTTRITTRKDMRGGVWVLADERGPTRKIAALGMRVSHGVTEHGFALNCNSDLTAYDRIVPCGIRDAGVTSLTYELGREVTVAEVLPMVESRVHMLFP
jgi:lipoyl(octanoyl) transferase